MLHAKKFAAAATRRNAVPTLLAIELANADAAAAPGRSGEADRRILAARA
jgi:hypothetical protein